jgi:putative ABC transport system substrate-binding protein
MRRRDFIAGLGSAAAWPLAARAQQGEPVRRIGLLMGYENDPVVNSLVSEFIQEFAKLGWTDGQNLRMDIRWAAGSVDLARMYAKSWSACDLK